MRKGGKEIDVIISGSDREREEYINRCIEQLLDNMSSIQWISLAHIRNELAPTTLQNKKSLLKSLIINPREKKEKL